MSGTHPDKTLAFMKQIQKAVLKKGIFKAD